MMTRDFWTSVTASGGFGCLSIVRLPHLGIALHRLEADVTGGAQTSQAS